MAEALVILHENTTMIFYYFHGRVTLASLYLLTCELHVSLSVHIITKFLSCSISVSVYKLQMLYNYK